MDLYTPALPPGLKLPKSSGTEPTDDSEEEAPRIGPIGPALPPGLKLTNPDTEDSENSSSSSDDEGSHQHHQDDSDHKHRSTSEHTSQSMSQHSIGPTLAPDCVLGPSSSDVKQSTSCDVIEDVRYVIGPVPYKGPQIEMSAAEEFELRAQRMKNKLLKKDTEDEGPVKREDWMLSLPDKMKKKVGIHVEAKSSFSRSKCTAERDETWTETPAQREHRQQEERDGVRRPQKRNAEDDGPSARDLQMHQEIIHHNKKHKREKSLLELHQKKIDKKKKKDKKKEKKKEKKARKKAKKEGKDFKEKRPERVPFDRERDLQANVFDDAMKKSALKKSAGMSSRFGGGSQRYL